MTARKSPSAAEALAEGIPFDYKGVSYTLPNANDWDIDALDAFEEGRVVAFIKSILGDAQYAALRKSGVNKVGELNEFVEAMTSAVGISGN